MADIKIPAPSDDPTPDKKAKEEEKDLETGRNLDQEAAEGKHDRDEITKKVLSIMICLLIFVAGLALMTGLFSWAWHLVMPSEIRWLCPHEVDEIQKLATSALLGMVASEYARRLFN